MGETLHLKRCGVYTNTDAGGADCAARTPFAYGGRTRRLRFAGPEPLLSRPALTVRYELPRLQLVLDPP